MFLFKKLLKISKMLKNLIILRNCWQCWKHDLLEKMLKTISTSSAFPGIFLKAYFHHFLNAIKFFSNCSIFSSFSKIACFEHFLNKIIFSTFLAFSAFSQQNYVSAFLAFSAFSQERRIWSKVVNLVSRDLEYPLYDHVLCKCLSSCIYNVIRQYRGNSWNKRVNGRK